MADGQKNISVIDPVDDAFGWVKVVLFRNFDLGKWFVIGFCAWLANLGQNGAGFNFSSGNMGSNANLPRLGCLRFAEGTAFGGFRPVQVIDDGFCALLANPGGNGWHSANLLLGEIWPFLAVGPVIIAVAVLAMWLVSRGSFMFLDCVVQNKAEVKRPWQEYKREGNSYFVFLLILAGIGLAAVLVSAALIGLAVSISGRNVVIASIIVPAVLPMSIVVLALIVAQIFTKDFVVPLMYLNRIDVKEGWRIFWKLLADNKLVFFLYLLFKIVIGLGALVYAMAIGFLTCCCGFVLLALPYINAVVLLPVHTFVRSYSIMFLKQFGWEYDVFKPEYIEGEVVE